MWPRRSHLGHQVCSLSRILTYLKDDIPVTLDKMLKDLQMVLSEAWPTLVLQKEGF